MPQPAAIELDRSFTISTFGFGKENTSYKKELIDAERRSSLLHLIDDVPVSNSFNYYISGEDIYLDEEKNIALYLAPEERGGKIKDGMISAMDYCLKNPGNLAFLYSPPGIVTFDSEDNNYLKSVKPYPDGQLYVYWADNEKVSALAVSVSKQSGEKNWLRKMFPSLFEKSDTYRSEVEYISNLITTPVLTDLNLDSFIDVNNFLFPPDMEIYENIHNQKFNLSDVLSMFVLGVDGQIRPKHDLDELDHDLVKTFGTSDIPIETKYLHALHYVRMARGDEFIKIAGSCGGDGVSGNELMELLGIEKLSHSGLMENTRNPLSTSSRTFNSLKQRSKDHTKDPNLCRCGNKEPHFHCPGKNKKGELCNHPITVGQGIEHCPACGKGKIC